MQAYQMLEVAVYYAPDDFADTEPESAARELHAQKLQFFQLRLAELKYQASLGPATLRRIERNGVHSIRGFVAVETSENLAALGWELDSAWTSHRERSAAQARRGALEVLAVIKVVVDSLCFLLNPTSDNAAQVVLDAMDKIDAVGEKVQQLQSAVDTIVKTLQELPKMLGAALREDRLAQYYDDVIFECSRNSAYLAIDDFDSATRACAEGYARIDGLWSVLERDAGRPLGLSALTTFAPHLADLLQGLHAGLQGRNGASTTPVKPCRLPTGHRQPAHRRFLKEWDRVDALYREEDAKWASLLKEEFPYAGGIFDPEQESRLYSFAEGEGFRVAHTYKAGSALPPDPLLENLYAAQSDGAGAFRLYVMGILRSPQGDYYLSQFDVRELASAPDTVDRRRAGLASAWGERLWPARCWQRKAGYMRDTLGELRVSVDAGGMRALPEDSLSRLVGAIQKGTS